MPQIFVGVRSSMRCRSLTAQPCNVCQVFSGAWAGRAVFETPGVVRMGVSEDNPAGTQPLEFSQPIEAAIDHHPGAAIRHQERAVHAISSRPRLDLTARAKKDELHSAGISRFRPSCRQFAWSFEKGTGLWALGKAPLLDLKCRESPRPSIRLRFSRRGNRGA